MNMVQIDEKKADQKHMDLTLVKKDKLQYRLDIADIFALNNLLGIQKGVAWRLRGGFKSMANDRGQGAFAEGGLGLSFHVDDTIFYSMAFLDYESLGLSIFNRTGILLRFSPYLTGLLEYKSEQKVYEQKRTYQIRDYQFQFELRTNISDTLQVGGMVSLQKTTTSQLFLGYFF